MDAPMSKLNRASHFSKEQDTSYLNINAAGLMTDIVMKEYSPSELNRASQNLKNGWPRLEKETTVLLCYVISAMHGYFYLNNWL